MIDLKGKLIVIEGTDGSGKKTQTAKLLDRLNNEGVSAQTIDFPRYGTPSAYFVEKYLHGGYGASTDVNAYAASLFYSLDRFDHAEQIRNMISKGDTIVCDRYTSANMGHQAGKIDNLAERDTYLEWLYNMEYGTLKIPKPDQTILLYVSPETNQKLMAQREDKEYLKGKKQDIHEADIDHLKKASEAFLYVAEKFNWTVINCAPYGELLSIDEIHQEIWKSIEMKHSMVVNEVKEEEVSISPLQEELSY
jgi:dTMP kinase